MKCPDGYQIYGKPLNLRDKDIRDKYKPYGMPFWVLAAIIAIYLVCVEYSFCALIILIVALILIYPIHEVFHYILQWICSGKRPHLGFHFPFPFSALDKEANLCKQQAIVAAVAPFIFITVICTIIAVMAYSQYLITCGILTHTQASLIIGIITFLNVAICSADFYLIKWLLKSPRTAILRQCDLINILCVPTRRQQSINKPPETMSPLSHPDTNEG